MLVEGLDSGGSGGADAESMPSNWAKSSSSVSFLDIFAMTYEIRSTMGLFKVEAARGCQETRMRNGYEIT